MIAHPCRRLCAFLFLCAPLLSAAPLTPRLEARLLALPHGPVHAWIYLSSGVDAQRFASGLRTPGLRLRRVSRWLNAVSVEGGAADLRKAAARPGVARIDAVEQFREPRPQTLAKATAPAAADSIYGHAFSALKLMRVPEAHEMPEIGLSAAGKGVTIALLDAGFNVSHEAFSHFDSATVVAARDYVAGNLDSTVDFDTVVYNEPGDSPDQESHGTSVLSVIAAYKPGLLVGIAPFSRFILAKTEETQAESAGVWKNAETVAEEDNWIAAVEWAVDTLNADIVSSSLGYRNQFTDGRPDYSINMLNGDSLAITRAADMAVQKGAVVLVAVGNDGLFGERTLSAPSDGNDLLAVGATDANGNLADYSARGPTADGRVKPDIIAPGHRSAVAEGTTNQYNLNATGTSFATPMAAGVCALLMQYLRARNIAFTPQELVQRFKSFSFFPAGIDSGYPGYGFGIVDAYGLIQEEKRRIETETAPIGDRRFLLFPVPVKGGTVRFEVATDNLTPVDDRSGHLTVAVYSVAGELLFRESKREETVGPRTAVVWDLKNRRGRRIAPGVYLVRARFDGAPVTKTWLKKFAVVR